MSKTYKTPVLQETIQHYISEGMVVLTLWRDTTLQKIKELSGKLAENNEYQVHYWALNFKKEFKDDSVFYIHIPTILFNYPQEVTYSSIDFDLNDVDDVSEAVEPLQKAQIQKAYNELKDKFPDFVLESVNLNSLHRHP